ncbi:hypothetical protein NL676_033039 [Syzygium grande]|nr:hypothetical protein NL676_033039 [Syzygium grande]
MEVHAERAVADFTGSTNLANHGAGNTATGGGGEEFENAESMESGEEEITGEKEKASGLEREPIPNGRSVRTF